MRTRKAVGEMRPSAFINHPSFLLYMVLKWAGLTFRRLFASPFSAANGVSSVVNCPRVDLTVARRFWYNSCVLRETAGH